MHPCATYTIVSGFLTVKYHFFTNSTMTFIISHSQKNQTAIKLAEPRQTTYASMTDGKTEQTGKRM